MGGDQHAYHDVFLPYPNDPGMIIDYRSWVTGIPFSRNPISLFGFNCQDESRYDNRLALRINHHHKGVNMKRLLIALIVTGQVFGMGSLSFSAEGVKPMILDVRTEAEWQSGHLEGAVLIPYDQIGKKIGTVVKDKSQRIYLYCRTGRRSEIAKEALDKLGYKDVINLETLEKASVALKIKIVK
jgi:phage shock protein E